MIDYPKPIHDYTDPSLYPADGDTDAFWDWEFLRRHPEFQQKTDSNLANREEVEDYDFWWAGWHYREKHSLDEVMEKIQEMRAPPWRLLSPKRSSHFFEQDDIGEGYFYLAQRLDDVVTTLPGLEDRLLIVALDPEAPDTQQLAKLKKLLRSARKESNDRGRPVHRHRTQNYHKLLRILDAIADDTKRAEIWEVLALEERHGSRVANRATETLNRYFELCTAEYPYTTLRAKEFNFKLTDQ